MTECVIEAPQRIRIRDITLFQFDTNINSNPDTLIARYADKYHFKISQ
jgi:hypothetical protein